VLGLQHRVVEIYSTFALFLDGLLAVLIKVFVVKLTSVRLSGFTITLKLALNLN